MGASESQSVFWSLFAFSQRAYKQPMWSEPVRFVFKWISNGLSFSPFVCRPGHEQKRVAPVCDSFCSLGSLNVPDEFDNVVFLRCPLHVAHLRRNSCCKSVLESAASKLYSVRLRVLPWKSAIFHMPVKIVCYRIAICTKTIKWNLPFNVRKCYEIEKSKK